jgi:Tfp pilus assembly protein FimT
MPELLIVVGISIIILAFAITPIRGVLQSYRLSGDARGIAAQLALARMRAASNFTKAEVNIDTTAQTYEVEVWSKSAAAYQPEGGAQPLSQGDVFGYGSLTTPAGGQSSIAQTTQIIFNSRGMCVDGAGNVTANDAIYFTNKSGTYFAVTVSVAGRPSVWKYIGSAWVAF